EQRPEVRPVGLEAERHPVGVTTEGPLVLCSVPDEQPEVGGLTGQARGGAVSTRPFPTGHGAQQDGARDRPALRPPPQLNTTTARTSDCPGWAIRSRGRLTKGGRDGFDGACGL